MNRYFNKNEEKILTILMNYPSEKAMELCEGLEESLESLKSKFNKKQIDRQAELPSRTFKDMISNEVVLSPRKDNAAIIITANKDSYPENYNGRFSYSWNDETLIDIVNYLHEYTVFTGDNLYKPLDKTYLEEVHICKYGVERSIFVNGNIWWFECYSGDINDNNWTYLTPVNVQEVLKHVIPYLFLSKKMKDHLPMLHEEVQGMYKKWRQTVKS